MCTLKLFLTFPLLVHGPWGILISFVERQKRRWREHLCMNEPAYREELGMGWRRAEFLWDEWCICWEGSKRCSYQAAWLEATSEATRRAEWLPNEQGILGSGNWRRKTCRGRKESRGGGDGYEEGLGSQITHSGCSREWELFHVLGHLTGMWRAELFHVVPEGKARMERWKLQEEVFGLSIYISVFLKLQLAFH